MRTLLKLGGQVTGDGEMKQIKRDIRKMADIEERILTQTEANRRWGIDKRITITDLDEIRDVTPVSTPSWGRRDPSDPSYAALKEIR